MVLRMRAVLTTPRGWCKLESILLLAVVFLPLSCTLGPLAVTRWGSLAFLDEDKMNRKDVKCIFKGRPRPQITWYKHGSKLESTLPFFSSFSCILGPLTVERWGSPAFLYENKTNRKDVKCIFKGRPRPQITWYKDGSNLKTFSHTEVETLCDNGIFKVTTTLHVPGRKEFAGIYKCFGNNSLSSGWSSSKEPMYGIELLFRCKKSLNSPLAYNWQLAKPSNDSGNATNH